uniref:Uncharacterized protein n=1 Tax=Leersia perrieri TaxID=77586 RepID=A0A0D9W1R6_9ORYZ
MASRQGSDGDGGCSGGAWDGNWAGRILEIIYVHYKKALDTLPLEHIPALAPRLLNAGVCFGFADPVTNIITNMLLLDCEGQLDLNEGGGGKKRKRRGNTSRDEVLSKIVTGDGSSPPESRTIAERSFYGLLSFLISYFRDLPTWDALRYLYLARVDLLVAVHLIQDDRCCRRRRKQQFCIRPQAVSAALKCAAYSARLPNTDAFLTGSFTLVSHLSLITHKTLSCLLSVEDISWLSRLLHEQLKLKKSDKPMVFAAQRLHHLDINASIGKVPAGRLMESMRDILLDRIHTQYLKAISLLPMEDLRIRHHRSLLKAGYCYGSFNPVNNIIVNTIWYDSTFPPSENFEVDMISTLAHIESRSLNGLIAFLRGSITDLSENDAMIYLMKYNLDSCKIIEMSRQEGYATSVVDDSGYKVAVDAASHPKSEEFVEFAMRRLPMVQSVVMSLLQDSRMLSSSVVCRLSTLLSDSSIEFLKPAVRLTEDAMKFFSSCKEDFLTQQSLVCRQVKAALKSYEQTTGNCYELCIICCVNDYVGKRRIGDLVKRQFSHVNFWANSSDGTSTIFFSQSSVMMKTTKIISLFATLCHMEHKYMGTRIVHPTENGWEGAREYEKITCGEHKLTNHAIISGGRLNDIRGGGIFAREYIYLDPAWDVKLVHAINHGARMRNRDVYAEMKKNESDGAVGQNS